MMAESAYILCAVTAAIVAILFLRQYRKTHYRLLLWSGICFLFFFLENVALFIDLEVIRDVDLRWIRLSLAMAGSACLLTSLIWESKS